VSQRGSQLIKHFYDSANDAILLRLSALNHFIRLPFGALVNLECKLEETLLRVTISLSGEWFSNSTPMARRNVLPF